MAGVRILIWFMQVVFLGWGSKNFEKIFWLQINEEGSDFRCFLSCYILLVSDVG